MAGIIFNGYWSSTQKQKAAQTKMVFANIDLITAQEDANEVSIFLASKGLLLL